jgi:ornithine decarboxylase
MERREFFKYTLLASAVPIMAGGIIEDIAPAAAAIVPVAPPALSREEVSARLSKLRARQQRANPPTQDVLNALQRFPNSVLLYDMAQVEENYLTFLEAEPGVEVYYAVKCAPNPRLMQHVASLGGGFDFASPVELDLALGTGVNPSKCIYSNTVKRASDIRYAYDHGVRAFVADSTHEVQKLAKNAPGSLLYVRLTVTGTFAAHPLGDKFGTSPENAGRLLILGKELGLVPFGTHFHVGTQCVYPQAWEQPAREAAMIFSNLKKQGIDLQFFDIGGGYPTKFASFPNPPSVGAILDVVKRTIDEELPGRAIRLAVEPGRGIAGTAGVVSARVMLRADRADGEWLHLDAGIYQGLFDAVDKYVYDVSVPGRTGAQVPYTLCGPTCDSFDTLSKGQKLPADIQEEDLLVFHNSAAYSEACNTRFNGMAPPAVHYLDEVLAL